MPQPAADVEGEVRSHQASDRSAFMKLITVAGAALNQTPMDWTGNTRNILAAIESAKAQSATVLCLPELCITGYGCEDQFASADLRARAEGEPSVASPARGDLGGSVVGAAQALAVALSRKCSADRSQVRLPA